MSIQISEISLLIICEKQVILIVTNHSLKKETYIMATKPAAKKTVKAAPAKKAAAKAPAKKAAPAKKVAAAKAPAKKAAPAKKVVAKAPAKKAPAKKAPAKKK